MSNRRAKAERSAYKDERQAPVPDELHHLSKRKKKPRKPWRVFSMVRGMRWCMHEAVTKEAAERWVEKESRSYHSVRHYRVVYWQARGSKPGTVR